MSKPGYFKPQTQTQTPFLPKNNTKLFVCIGLYYVCIKCKET